MNSNLPIIKKEESKKEIIITILIPGVTLSDIELEIKEYLLKVTVSKISKNESENFNEWENLLFVGEIKLPCKVIPTIPYRSYNNELLEIKLKKA